jgi:hypothetical protein
MNKQDIFSLCKESSMLIKNSETGLNKKKQKKLVSKIIDCLLAYNLSGDCINMVIYVEKILTWVNEIIALSNISIGQCPKKVIDGLAYTFTQAFITKRISFISILGVGHTNEYNDVFVEASSIVKSYLENLDFTSELRWNYQILLSVKFDNLIKKSDSSFLNKDLLLSGLDTVLPSEYFDSYNTEILSIDDDKSINSKIISLSGNNELKNNFLVLDEKISRDVENYALYGKLLENKNTPIVLIDLQKHIYPYQQPCYQLLRKSPLPVISMQGLVKKLIYK